MECLESGVFRSDLPTSFKLDSSGYEVSSGNLSLNILTINSFYKYEDTRVLICRKKLKLSSLPH